MKKFFTGVLALTICAVINFGLTGEAQAADLESASSLNDVELQELYGPPPPPGRHDYGPPPPHRRHPPMHRPWHRPGPPPPPPMHGRKYDPPPPPPEPYRNQRPRW